MRGIAWAAGTVAAVLLAAGCGTAHGQGAGPGHGTTVAAATTSLSTITRQRAGRLARTLLARASLPPGARISLGRPPAAAGQAPDASAGSPSIQLHELWTVAEPTNAVYSFVSKHTPAGMKWSGSGQALDGTLVTQEFVSYRLGRVPVGVGQASLTLTVAPDGAGGSLLRADAQVIWFPQRPAAESVPASMHAVSITASYAMPQHNVTRIFTAPATVQRLAALLNGAHASTGGVMPCPMELVSYRLAFARSAGATPYLTATESGCQILSVTVAGHQQPSLVMPACLGAELTRLMHSPTYGPSTPGTRISPLPPTALAAK
jgi:hypothetical protein